MESELYVSMSPDALLGIPLGVLLEILLRTSDGAMIVTLHGIWLEKVNRVLLDIEENEVINASAGVSISVRQDNQLGLYKQISNSA